MQNEQSRQLNHADHHSENVKYPISLLLDNLELPINVGGIFRIADAFGVEKMYLTGKTPIPPNRKIKKASRSTERFVNHEHVGDPVKLATQLRNQGYHIISLEITDHSQSLAEYSLNAEKILLIVGSENLGIRQELLELSDLHLHVPMRGENSSMNVASITAIAVYEITKLMQAINQG